MIKYFIIIIQFLFVETVFSQQKKNDTFEPNRLKFGLKEKEIVDYTTMRFYYALNATDIKDRETYIDLGMLQIGSKMSKYSSAFLAHSDSMLIDWHKSHPNAKAIPYHLELSGRECGIWSEYQYSEFFVEDEKLTEWAVMPRFAENDCCRYTELYPLMKWTLQKETSTICGHKCQKATCHFRGRDFEAWFAPSIPIRKGPWKFGGLPGLIMKVYDKDKFYTFECVKVEKGRFPIVKFPDQYFPEQTRTKVYKLQIKLNNDYDDSVGLMWYSPKKKYEYYPLELE